MRNKIFVMRAGFHFDLQRFDGAVCKIGSTEYETFAAAINAATSGDTITLLADVTEDVTISGKALTLDLDGKTLTGDVALSDGSLTIDGKTFTVTTGSATATFTNGSLTKITGSDEKDVIANDFAGVTINAGKGSDNITNNGAHVTIERSEGADTVTNNGDHSTISTQSTVTNNGDHCTIDNSESSWITTLGENVTEVTFTSTKTGFSLPSAISTFEQTEDGFIVNGVTVKGYGTAISQKTGDPTWSAYYPGDTSTPIVWDGTPNPNSAFYDGSVSMKYNYTAGAYIYGDNQVRYRTEGEGTFLTISGVASRKIVNSGSEGTYDNLDVSNYIQIDPVEGSITDYVVKVSKEIMHNRYSSSGKSQAIFALSFSRKTFDSDVGKNYTLAFGNGYTSEDESHMATDGTWETVNDGYKYSAGTTAGLYIDGGKYMRYKDADTTAVDRFTLTGLKNGLTSEQLSTGVTFSGNTVLLSESILDGATKLSVSEGYELDFDAEAKPKFHELTLPEGIEIEGAIEFGGKYYAKDGSIVTIGDETFTIDGDKHYYVDSDGKIRLTDATILEGSETSLDEGWYIVNSDLTIDEQLTFSGDANLILADGAKLTINYNAEGIFIDGTLNIYGQSSGTGNLEATGNNGIFANNGNININGGQITANGYFDGIFATGDVNIYGGQVTANGTNENGIFANSTINLSWTKATDFIDVSSYSVTPNFTKRFYDASGNVYDERENYCA